MASLRMRSSSKKSSSPSSSINTSPSKRPSQRTSRLSGRSTSRRPAEGRRAAMTLGRAGMRRLVPHFPCGRLHIPTELARSRTWDESSRGRQASPDPPHGARGPPERLSMTKRKLGPIVLATALGIGAGCQRHFAQAANPTPVLAAGPATPAPFATPPVLPGTPDVATLVAKVTPAVVNITTIHDVHAPQQEFDFPFGFDPFG